MKNKIVLFLFFVSVPFVSGDVFGLATGDNDFGSIELSIMESKDMLFSYEIDLAGELTFSVVAEQGIYKKDTIVGNSISSDLDEGDDLDKSLDLLLESNLENHYDELNSIHSKQQEKSSFQGAMMLSNPLPSQAEYDALMDLYQSTGGENWIYNIGWSSADPNVVQYVGNWQGILVDTNGHITHLDLKLNNLQGEVPASLTDLIDLEGLQLWGNSLSGDLEDWFGVFPKLKLIHVSDNYFTGPIPSAIGLNLSLEEVHFQRNQLSGSIPSSIGNLSNLRWLVLYDNQFSGVIPSSFGNLSSLEYLYLYRSGLFGSIPASLGNMHSLKFLGLHTNSLSGEIPSSLGDLANLETILLHHNQLSGIVPSTLGSLSNLEVFSLYANQLSGNIPSELGSLNQVLYFFLHENQLSGSIPVSLGNLSSLILFRLNFNKLTSSIPTELGNLTHLEDMRLDNNQLSGTIPPSLCSLPNLVVFHAQMNQLTGDIPLCLLTSGPGEFQLAFNYYYFTDLVNKTQYWSQQSFYSPQRTDPQLTSYVVDGNGGITLSTTVGMNHSNASSYKWFKDDIAVTTDSPGNDSVTIPCPSSGNGAFNCDGRYVAEVTNPGYPTIVLLAEGGEIEGEEILQITICSLEKLNPTIKSLLASVVDVADCAELVKNNLVESCTFRWLIRDVAVVGQSENKLFRKYFRLVYSIFLDDFFIT